MTSPVAADDAFGRVLVHTRSLDQAERRSSALLSPHRLHLADHRAFDARIDGVSLGGVGALRMRYGSAVTVVGAPPDGFVAAIVPLRGAMSVEHNGQRFEVAARRTGAVIAPGSPLVLRWGPGLILLCVRFELAALQAFADLLDPSGQGTPLSFHTPITDPHVVLGLLGWASTVQALGRQSPSGSPTIGAPVTTRLREQAMASLLVAQPNSRRCGLMSGDDAVARNAIRKAVAIIEADPASCPTATHLAQRTGISVRTLHQGFREELGTTPHSYVSQVRLRRAHDDLVLCAGGGTTVTAVARRWGFSNVGRFANIYASVFGELPSQTLRAR